MIYHFINLTNGIEAIEEHHLTDYRFIRIQSTACEQKRWEDILWAVSDDFLMLVALGHSCIVYDYSGKREVSRAIWQGLEWIKFVLMKHWFDVKYIPEVRGQNCSCYFEDAYRKLSKRITRRLTYYDKFILVDKRSTLLNITSVTSRTDNDGNCAYYTRIIKNQGKVD